MIVRIAYFARKRFIKPSNLQHNTIMLGYLHRALKRLALPDEDTQGSLFAIRPRDGKLTIKIEHVIHSLFLLSDRAGRYWLGTYQGAGIKEVSVPEGAYKEIRDSAWG